MKDFKVSGYLLQTLTVSAASKRDAAAKAAHQLFAVKPEQGEEVLTSDLGGRGFDVRVRINPNQARISEVLYVDPA